jgi:hypothetical protein
VTSRREVINISFDQLVARFEYRTSPHSIPGVNPGDILLNFLPTLSFVNFNVTFASSMYAIDQKPIESPGHTPHAEPEELGTLRPVDRRTI